MRTGPEREQFESLVTMAALCDEGRPRPAPTPGLAARGSGPSLAHCRHTGAPRVSVLAFCASVEIDLAL